MSRWNTLALALATLAGCASMQAIDDTQLGLRKGSVFEQSTPAPFAFTGPGTGPVIAPLAGSGMPPMITHAIDEYLPITTAENGCLACHHRPTAIGKTTPRGQPSPVPASHYAKRANGEISLAGANFVCTGCHAPQAGVAPLIDNRSM